MAEVSHQLGGAEKQAGTDAQGCWPPHDTATARGERCLAAGSPAHRHVVAVLEPVSPVQNGQAALRPSSITFMTVKVASVKPPIVYRPRSPDGSADGR